MGDEIGQSTKFYYCLKHKTVEPEGVCKAKDRLGPFPTAAAAAQALETVHERELQKQNEDREWRNG